MDRSRFRGGTRIQVEMQSAVGPRSAWSAKRPGLGDVRLSIMVLPWSRWTRSPGESIDRAEKQEDGALGTLPARDVGAAEKEPQKETAGAAVRWEEK